MECYKYFLQVCLLTALLRYNWYAPNPTYLKLQSDEFWHTYIHHEAITTIKWTYPSPSKVQCFLRTLFNASLLFFFIDPNFNMVWLFFYLKDQLLHFFLCRSTDKEFLQISFNWFCLITSRTNFKCFFLGKEFCLTSFFFQHSAHVISFSSDLHTFWQEVWNNSCLYSSICNVLFSLNAFNVFSLSLVSAVWLWCALVWFSLCLSCLGFLALLWSMGL